MDPLSFAMLATKALQMALEAKAAADSGDQSRADALLLQARDTFAEGRDAFDNALSDRVSNNQPE